MPGDTPVYEHIYGAPYIYATLFTQRFRISPQSFVQPNIAAAEVSVNYICINYLKQSPRFSIQQYMQR
jgi:hypothetical protein